MTVDTTDFKSIANTAAPNAANRDNQGQNQQHLQSLTPSHQGQTLHMAQSHKSLNADSKQ